MSRLTFTSGNEVRLLHCGEEYFAALKQAIDSAEKEIYLETYIFTSDATATEIKIALIKAAARGIIVRVIIDWVGSGDRTADALANQLTAANVACRCFNPWFKRGLARTHRKVCVVDQRIAFVGGLNIVSDLISDDGSGTVLPLPRWDFAVAVTGPLVPQIYDEECTQWRRIGKLDLKHRLKLLRDQRNKTPLLPNDHQAMMAAFLVRDNFRNRATIQRAYLHALGKARTSAILANPYFAPGRKFRRALVAAAERGVQVTLILGVGQFHLQDAVAHAFYPKLLKKGVKIVEYNKTQLHGKVAVVDSNWATVGSSNIDGLSLFLNQEANVIVNDAGFTATLTTYLQQAIADSTVIALADFDGSPWYKRIWYGTAYLVYRALMRIVTWGGYS